MTKNYRKITCWLRDVEVALKNPAKKPDESVLRLLGWTFGPVCNQLVHQPEMTDQLIHLLSILRNASGAGRAVFERKVTEMLVFVAAEVCARIGDASLFPKPLAANPEQLPSDRRDGFVFLQKLCLHAMDCFRFSRPRDSLAGERRSKAFELFLVACPVIEPPDAFFDYLKNALKRARKNEVTGAMLFCEKYYAKAGGVPGEIAQLLLGVVKKTKTHGIAVGALSVLVECGTIGEFEALDWIDDWKEQNCRYHE